MTLRTLYDYKLINVTISSRFILKSFLTMAVAEPEKTFARLIQAKCSGAQVICKFQRFCQKTLISGLSFRLIFLQAAIYK